MKRTYKNKTNEYQLIGNCQDIIKQGTKTECDDALNKISVADSKYGVIEIVKPGEQIKRKFDDNKINMSNDKNLIDQLFK